MVGDARYRDSLSHDIFRSFQRSCFLADFGNVLYHVICDHDEAPAQAHDEAQICPLDLWQEKVSRKRRQGSGMRKF